MKHRFYVPFPPAAGPQGRPKRKPKADWKIRPFTARGDLKGLLIGGDFLKLLAKEEGCRNLGIKSVFHPLVRTNAD